MENFEKLTALPETLTVVNLPQLSFEELDGIDVMTLNEKTDDELKQIAQSGANAADVIMNTETSKVHALTYDPALLRANAKAMSDIFKTGNYDVSAQFAGSLVIADKVLTEISKPNSVLEISYDNYQHLTRAVSTTFRGNIKVAGVLSNIFLAFNNVAIEIVNSNERLKKYELLYKAGSDIVAQREAAEKAAELLEQAEAEGIEIQVADDSKSVIDLTGQ